MAISKRKVFEYGVWAAFGLFLIFSISLVFMYHDDFGYVSLSYVHIEPDVQGVNFTFGQLFNFLVGIYEQWSGRVIFPGLKILLLRESIWLFRIVQSLAVLVSFIVLHKLAVGNRKCALTVLLFCSLYGAFSLQMFREGFYWFSASATFVIPLKFFFVGCVIMQHIDNGAKHRSLYIVLGSLCFFLAGASVEQTSLALMGFTSLFLLFDFIQYRKLKLHRICFFVSSLAGSAFLLLAPGNFNRFSVSDVEASFFHRVARNLWRMGGIYLNLEFNFVFILLFGLFICCIAHILFRNNKVKKAMYIAAIPSSMSFYLAAFYFTALDDFTTLNIILVMIFYAYVALSMYLIIKYMLFIKNNYLTALFLGALFSQVAMLFFVPYVIPRMMIVFYFVLFAIFARVFADFKEVISKEKLVAWILIPILILTSVNMGFKTYGYYLNKPANVHNDTVLREASQNIGEGKVVEVIELIPFPEWLFAKAQFHWSLPFWLREFYGIPENVEIINPGWP